MHYLLMIYTNESAEADSTPAARDAMLQEYFAFVRDARAAGVYVTGDELQPTRAALTVRVREGQALNARGPYAETKEQLGGYFMLNCSSAEEAAQWAAKIPGARHGFIEVRPIVDDTSA